MCNGKDTVPFDNADLHKGAGVVWTDEHRHRVILNKMSDMETDCVEHGRIGNTMAVGTVKDDQIRLHATRLLVASNLVERSDASHRLQQLFQSTHGTRTPIFRTPRIQVPHRIVTTTRYGSRDVLRVDRTEVSREEHAHGY